MRRWYLMRHGQTDYNLRRCFYGREDVPINDRGRSQAKDLARKMLSHPVEALYISSLRRSQETAKLVLPKQEFQALSGLDERDFGLWEGLTADEIEAAFPQIWSVWLEAPFAVTPPEAEDFSAFQDRVWQTTAALLEKGEENLAIVAHLGVLRLIYQYLLDKDADFWSIDVPQGQILVLEEQEQAWQAFLL